jgi:hypothetical protein
VAGTWDPTAGLGTYRLSTFAPSDDDVLDRASE